MADGGRQRKVCHVARTGLDFARHERQGRRVPGREAGFTLLELMVALAIFSLAALALVRLQGVSVRTSADLDAKMMAEIVARNMAAEIETDPQPPTLGASQGTVDNGGRRFLWQRNVARSDDPRLIRIDLRVTAATVPVSSVLSFVRTAS